MTLLVTRLHGHRTILQRLPTGLGTDIWVGELRSDQDQPMWLPDEPFHTSLRVAPDLGDLVRALDILAASTAGDRPENARRRALRRQARLDTRRAAQQGSEALQRAHDGHLEGTSIGNPDPYRL